MKILIPMAGEGSRFVKEGYTFPKPLIGTYSCDSLYDFLALLLSDKLSTVSAIRTRK